VPLRLAAVRQSGELTIQDRSYERLYKASLAAKAANNRFHRRHQSRRWIKARVGHPTRCGGRCIRPIWRSRTGTPAPEDVLAGAPGDADTTPTLGGDGDNLSGTVPTVPQPAAPGIEYVMPPGFDVFKQSSQSALDGAIAASISQAGSENRIKAAAGNILLIGGASALKGLPGILQDRYVATRTFICSMLATPHWDPGTGSDARVGYGRL
jgi:actin-related protein